MASASVRAHCIPCGKERATSKCGGCLQDFCYKHLGDHRQDLGKQLDDIEVTRDVFWQSFNELQLEAWQSVHHQFTQHFTQIKDKFNRLTNELRQSREDEDYFESDLHRWNEELIELSKQLSNSPISKISANVPFNEGSNIEGNTVLASGHSNLQSEENHSPRADPQLVRLFKSVNDQGMVVQDSEVLKYIREQMDTSEKFYIQKIVLSYLEACLIDGDRQKKILKDIVKSRMAFLNAIIEHKLEAQIQVMYAMQSFVNKFQDPPKMARLLFDIFYNEECVDDNAFFTWLNQSETEEHAAIKMSKMDFFTWLQQLEIKVEESEEEWD